MANDGKAAGLQQAFAALAAEQFQKMSDEDLARYAQAVVAMLEAIQAEYDRRQGKSRGAAPIGRA